MENKYNELERLNQLKTSGTITDTEFEIQKSKILNTKTEMKIKKNKSKIFFIITFISFGITLVLGIISYLWHDSDMYIYTLLNNKSLNGVISNIVDGSFILIISITIIMLILGFIFKIKEKGGIKIEIVD